MLKKFTLYTDNNKLLSFNQFFFFFSGHSANGSTLSKKSILGSMTIRSKTGEKADFVGSRVDKMRQSNKKLKNRVGVESEDIHVCIMCLRAIMNNKFGFNMVIAHEQAINCIALSLVRIKKPRLHLKNIFMQMYYYNESCQSKVICTFSITISYNFYHNYVI